VETLISWTDDDGVVVVVAVMMMMMTMMIIHDWDHWNGMIRFVSMNR
jgi:hypothetical protein